MPRPSPLLSVYGVRTGLDIETASLALTALVAGNVLLQFPIGWLADLYPKRQVMTGCAIATIIGLLVLPFCMGSWLMWPVLVVVGSTGYGLYVALAELGDRFRGDELVAGSAAFAAMGDRSADRRHRIGFAMAVFGPHGLPLSLALFLVLFLLAIIIRDYRGGGISDAAAHRAGLWQDPARDRRGNLLEPGRRPGPSHRRHRQLADRPLPLAHRSRPDGRMDGPDPWSHAFAVIRHAGLNGVVAGIAVGLAGLCFVLSLFYTTVAQSIFHDRHLALLRRLSRLVAAR